MIAVHQRRSAAKAAKQFRPRAREQPRGHSELTGSLMCRFSKIVIAYSGSYLIRGAIIGDESGWNEGSSRGVARPARRNVLVGDRGGAVSEPCGNKGRRDEEQYANAAELSFRRRAGTESYRTARSPGESRAAQLILEFEPASVSVARRIGREGCSENARRESPLRALARLARDDNRAA